MANELKITGIVLSTIPIGDYDKRLIILTKEKGRITVFARGSRKPNSKLLSCTQVFSFGEFILYPTKKAYNLKQGNLKNSFFEIRGDIEQLSYGMYLNELIGYISTEEEKSYDMVILLYKALLVLSKKVIPNKLIKNIFELRLLSMVGLMPEVVNCIKNEGEVCGQIKFFSVSDGGVVCKEHGLLLKDKLKISESTRYTMQYILSSDINKLFSFNVSREVMNELSQIMKGFINYHMSIKFKSLEFIEGLDNI